MAWSVPQLQFFAQFIQKELGIMYGEHNFFQLEKRLGEIAKNLGLAGDDELYALAQRGIHGPMRQMLLDVATNNETSFFRDPKSFKSIEAQVLPALRAAKPHLPVLRIWSAACSFGQEPYSLAIMLSEMAEKDPKAPRFEIVATDISETALARAAAGRFTQLEIQRGLPAALLVKYFTKDEEDHWTVKPALRSCVRFKKLNLLESFRPLGDFELILCRNVLIYQKDEKKHEIIRNIAGRLPTGGFFMMGAAEGMSGADDLFERVVQEGSVYFRRKAA